MSSRWLDFFFHNLLEAKVQSSPLEVLGSHVAYMFFLREGTEFCVLSKRGYTDPSFFYSFLCEKPDLLGPLLEDGYLQLPSEEGSQLGYNLWATVDRTEQPNYLLLAELPPDADSAGPFLRLVLAFELLYRQGAREDRTSASMDLPIWLEEILAEFLDKDSPILVVSEAGSGKEELVQAFLKNKYGTLEAAAFFHPGRLSQAVQLRELFGDPAGVRLGGNSPTIPIIDRKEPVVVIQEAGDLDRIAQLRLLALFSTSREKKLWIFETCRDLHQMTAAERFLPGLNELLWKNTISLPPLRNCVERLGNEVERLMNIFRENYRRKVELSPPVHDALSKYHWPGNWKELKNTLESAFLMASGNLIHEKDLRLGRWAVPEDWDNLNLRRHSEAVEKMLLLRAYALHSGNQVQMARALGISRGSLQYKMDKHRLN